MTGVSESLLLKMLEQLRDDFATERESARQSRAIQHGRIDEVIERLGRIDTTVALAGQVDAQVRNELDTLTKTMADIMPVVEDWRRTRALGLGIVGLMTAGGLSIGAIVSWGGDTAAAAIRRFLHIP